MSKNHSGHAHLSFTVYDHVECLLRLWREGSKLNWLNNLRFDVFPMGLEKMDI